MARVTETIGQDELIVASALAPDQMVVRDFEAEGVVVDLVEHDLHELNILRLFGAINRLRAFVEYPSRAEKKFGARANAVIAGAERNSEEMEGQARSEFLKSIGFFTVEAAADSFPHIEMNGFRRGAQNLWETFQRRFHGTNRVDARHEHARQLREHITYVQSGYNQKNELRPHMSNPVRKERELPELSSRDRIIALSEEPRIRYLVSSNPEKTLDMSWADYLDNPEHPLGVNDQLIEVFRHFYNLEPTEERPNALPFAQRSGVSITYELIDYLTNARDSLEALSDFGTKIELANPRLKLSQVLPDGHPAIAVIIRHRDQARFRDTGETPEGIKDPFRSHPFRWKKGLEPGKHKTIEDIYTGRHKTNEMKQYIQDEASSMTMKQAARLWRDSTENQQAREAFLSDRVNDISKIAHQRLLPMGALALAFRNRPLIAV